MGVDYYQFKLKKNIDQQYLKALIRQQHESYKNYEPDVYQTGCYETKVNKQEYIPTCQKIKECLNFQTIEYKGNNYINSSRTYAITRNLTIPLEWQIEARRTILPKELPHYVQKWRVFLQQANEGAYEAYFYDLYLYLEFYEEDFGLLNTFKKLKENIKKSHQISNAWAQKEKFIIGRKAIEKTLLKPTPYITKYPKFSDYTIDQKATPMTLKNYQDFQKKWEDLNSLLRQWNPISRWKIRTSAIPQIQAYQIGGNEEEFFKWCEQAIQQNNGLYLDA